MSKDNGEKQIMWFLKPKEYKNMAFLKIQNADNINMTMWYPRYKKIRKIPSQNKDNSFMSSDLTYEDLYTRNIDDFKYNLLGEEKLESQSCYIIESIPTDKIASNYSKHHTWISIQTLTPLQEISYDKEQNPDKKKIFFYTFQDGKEIINSIKIINLKEKNYFTNIYINDIILDSHINDDTFKENKLKRRPN